ncbi:uncharacterized protein LOC143144375 isoform X2 [Ptiloglossa arizonensis]|uniref:uncharacterized protein LOC143144375 isoform X2 n=1 Tax=Ptiloglossa arizonensis TaxID=3350558 RepID=UPI003FA0DE6E
MECNGKDNVKEENKTSRGKVSSAEKDLWMKPLLKLKQQEDIIERGMTTAIGNMKIDADLLQEIVQEHKEMSTKRQKFLNMMYKNMKDIATEMESAKRIAKNPEEVKILDINTYKLKLIKFWQKMQDFKKSCSIQNLVEEQTVLDAELREFEPQLQKYENIHKNVLSSCQNRIGNKKERQDYRDVEDFHTLVARTGHTENWTMEDHLFFLKTRKKCKSIPDLVSTIQRKCPDLSTTSIVNHEAWYKMYRNLRERQRSTVKEWRQKKDLNKMKNIEELENVQSDVEEGDCVNEFDEQDKVISKKTKTTRPKASRSSNSADSNESEKKELIRKWRIEKENKRTMDEEQLKMRIKLKRETEENQRRKRREKIQGALEEYKKKKSLESASRESSAHSKEKCTYNSTLIKAFSTTIGNRMRNTPKEEKI